MQPFVVHLPKEKRISPIVFDTPHSGSFIPPHIQTQATEEERLFLRDAHVEKLVVPAARYGIPVLENRIDRVVIDPNSEEDEINLEIFRGEWHLPSRPTRNITVRELGLVATSMKQRDGSLRPIFNRETSPTTEDIRNRLNAYYRPYHAQLRRLLDQAFDAHGFAIHINFHSAPRCSIKGHDILLGDLEGKSAPAGMVDSVNEFFKSCGMNVGLNAPYPGGALIRKNSNPSQGFHGIQIEMARELFLTEDFGFDDEKGASLREIIGSFSEHLLSYAHRHAPILKAHPARTDGPEAFSMGCP